jgi:transcriptional regulator with XRE-family HTH domain
MGNDALRHAMAVARKTERDVASACEVDVKTVSRWLSDEARLPHPGHRWAAAEALGVDEAVLWPEAIRTAVKVGPDKEIVSVYPVRSAIPRSLWRSLILAAQRNIEFAGYTNYFTWLEIPGLAATLRRKAESGVAVRFLVGDPESEVTRRRQESENVPLSLSVRIAVTLDELGKLREAGVEARFTDYMGTSVFRFDNQMIVTGGPVQAMGHNAPALHLQRRQDEGIFDAYALHIETLWEAGRPVHDARV